VNKASESGQYHPAKDTDVFYDSYFDHVRQFKAGEEIARRIMIFFWKSHLK
jgi:hypothetical protein